MKTTSEGEKPNNPEKGPDEKYSYFVDGVKYDWGQEKVTGAQIRAQLPDSHKTYGLFLEGNGKDPDQKIEDSTVVNLEKEKGPRRFYTVPPATFGAR
jgi:hypothetical protein